MQVKCVNFVVLVCLFTKIFGCIQCLKTNSDKSTLRIEHQVVQRDNREIDDENDYLRDCYRRRELLEKRFQCGGGKNAREVLAETFVLNNREYWCLLFDHENIEKEKFNISVDFDNADYLEVFVCFIY